MTARISTMTMMTWGVYQASSPRDPRRLGGIIIVGSLPRSVASGRRLGNAV